MKYLSKLILPIAMLSVATVFAVPSSVEAAEAEKALKVRVISFKTCVEKSKLGKQEQANFDALKNQMESMLGEKEKVLNDMAEKFNDPDYLDSLSPEAETELKRKFRALSQEASQQQSQYYQALQQANVKVLEKLDSSIIKSSEIVSKKNGYNVVLNDDSIYFNDKELDISDQIVAAMDELFDNEAKTADKK
jgi:outer membrane protein